MKPYGILTLNQISAHGLERFPKERYQVGGGIEAPDAILVRSHDLHAMAIPRSVKAIGRAGAGTNNIPVAALSQRGVPVFNAPGPNAKSWGPKWSIGTSKTELPYVFRLPTGRPHAAISC